MSDITAEQVREELSNWLDENWDPDLTVHDWWIRLAADAWAHPALPEAAGGRGYGSAQMSAFNATMADAGVLGPPMGLGYMLAAPTIAMHGTQEQVDRLVAPILDGSVGWCQLFSEPGAGSDLAGLQARAVRDGDEWIVTGQKVWTSGGQIADKGMLIARTDPDQPKHQGITYFAIDIDQAGIEVRPLREMTGEALFNEVFLDEARVSNDDVIGGLGNGWAVANTTLAVERASLGGGGRRPVAVTGGPKAGRLEDRVGGLLERLPRGPDGSGGRGITTDLLVDLAKNRGMLGDPVVRQAMMRLHILGEVNRWNMLRARAGAGRTGGEGNMAKLAMSELVRQSREVGNLVNGADGMLDHTDSSTGGIVQEMTLFSPAPSIYGGTDQVQRNIIGERVLGLAKEPGPAKGTPFRDLPQN